jgi:hypothetical protein
LVVNWASVIPANVMVVVTEVVLAALTVAGGATGTAWVGAGVGCTAMAGVRFDAVGACVGSAVVSVFAVGKDAGASGAGVVAGVGGGGAEVVAGVGGAGVVAGVGGGGAEVVAGVDGTGTGVVAGVGGAGAGAVHPLLSTVIMLSTVDPKHSSKVVVQAVHAELQIELAGTTALIPLDMSGKTDKPLLQLSALP